MKEYKRLKDNLDILENHNEIHTPIFHLTDGKTHEKDVVCPYCGYHIEDDDYWFLEEEYGEYACPECEKTFTFQAHREITYCTQRKESENER